MTQAKVTPLSKKAKNRFANIMNHDALCIVEQHKGNTVFLASSNHKHFFWASLDNDPHWMIEL